MAAALLWILSAFVTPANGDQKSPPAPEAALRASDALQASIARTDLLGNLWTWSRLSGKVRLFGKDGTEAASAFLSGAINLDVHKEWGIAGLVNDGDEIRLVRFSEPAPRSVPLSTKARGIVWLSPDTVAISPALSAHRVEIWNIRDRTMRKSFGDEKVIQPGSGLTRLRVVTLRYSPSRDLLYTLDTFTGDLQVFKLSGDLVKTFNLPNPRKAADEAWLAAQAAQPRPGVRLFSLSRLDFTLDEQGNIWSIVRTSSSGETCQILKLALDGSSRAIPLDSSCCASGLVEWGEYLVFTSDPELPGACAEVRRVS